MAMPALILHFLVRAAREQGGGIACSAGYPDLLVTPAQLDELLGKNVAARIPVRNDSSNIIQWHGAGRFLDCIFDSEAVFRELGYQLDVIDIASARGNEIIIDLNEPVPQNFDRSYDILLDTGTCEHCFNIGQAAINLASMVKLGGYLIQAMPLNSYNHGFYNVNPTWFADFYPSNGFEILHLEGISDVVFNPQSFGLPLHDRFNQAPENSIILMVARRSEMQDIRIPTQHKYVANPKLGNKF